MTPTAPAFLLFAAVLGTGLASQTVLGPRSFFPPDYQCEFFADLAALRANGIYEAFERSVAAPALARLEREAMASLEHVERVRYAVRLCVSDQVAGGVKQLRAFVAEGRELDPAKITPKAPYPWGSFEADTIGDHPVHVWVGTEVWKLAFVAPQKGLFVNGDLELLEPILERKATGGVARPELLALLSPRDVLAHLAMSRCGLATGAWLQQLPAPPGWLQTEDPVEGFCVQLVERDGVIRLEGLVRFAKEGTGIAHLEAKVRELLEAAKTDRRMGALKRLWNEITISRDGADLRAHIALGAPERAAGALLQLILPAVLRTMEARAAAVRVAEAKAREAEQLQRLVEQVQEARQRAQEAQSRPTDKE